MLPIRWARTSVSVSVLKACVAVLDELIFQRMVVFDHAIVNERDFAAGVEVRMGILVG